MKRFISIFFIFIISYSLCSAYYVNNEENQNFSPNDLNSMGVNRFEKAREDLRSASQNLKTIFDQIEYLDCDQSNLFIKYYSSFARNYLQRALKRMEEFFPIIRSIAQKQKLPNELVLFALSESGFAVFSFGDRERRGIWNLRKDVALKYGLRVDSDIDERLDFFKSTEAAFQYIRHLAKIYSNDWNFVILAYHDPHRARRLKKKYPHKSFLELYRDHKNENPYFETVFKFHALLKIVRNSYNYNFEIPYLRKKNLFLELVLKESINKRQFCKRIGLPIYAFNEYNPHFLTKKLPKGFTIYLSERFRRIVDRRTYRNLPKIAYSRYFIFYDIKEGETLSDIASRFHTSEKVLKEYNKLEYLSQLTIGDYLKIPRKPGRYYGGTLIYRVRRGDYLGKIARRFRISIRSIKRLNGLRSSRLRVGQHLRIRRAVARIGRKGRRYRRRYRNRRHRRARSYRRQRKYKRYRVKRGDSLRRIAKKFHTSVRRIARLNNIERSSLLRKGKVLLIP